MEVARFFALTIDAQRFSVTDADGLVTLTTVGTATAIFINPRGVAFMN